MIAGSACLKASSALLRSPLAIASSTLPTNVRSRERRALLTAVRRAILRGAFLADDVLAISLSFCGRPLDRRHPPVPEKSKRRLEPRRQLALLIVALPGGVERPAGHVGQAHSTRTR